MYNKVELYNKPSHFNWYTISVHLILSSVLWLSILHPNEGTVIVIVLVRSGMIHVCRPVRSRQVEFFPHIPSIQLGNDLNWECNQVNNWRRPLHSHVLQLLITPNSDILSASLLDDFYEENEHREHSQSTSSHRSSQPSSPSRGGFLSSFSFLRDGFTNANPGRVGQCMIKYAHA